MFSLLFFYTGCTKKDGERLINLPDRIEDDILKDMKRSAGPVLLTILFFFSGNFLFAQGNPAKEPLIAFVYDGWHPYSAIVGGEAEGFLVDYGRLLAEKTDRTIIFIPITPEKIDSAVNEYFRNGKPAILLGPDHLSRDYPQLVSLNPFAEARLPVVIYSDLYNLPIEDNYSGILFGQMYDPLAVILFNAAYPEANEVIYSTPSALLDAAEDRDILAFIPPDWNKTSSLSDIRAPKGFKAVMSGPISLSITLAMDNTDMIRDLKAGMAVITDPEINRLAEKWRMEAGVG